MYFISGAYDGLRVASTNQIYPKLQLEALSMLLGFFYLSKPMYIMERVDNTPSRQTRSHKDFLRALGPEQGLGRRFPPSHRDRTDTLGCKELQIVERYSCQTSTCADVFFAVIGDTERSTIGDGAYRIDVLTVSHLSAELRTCNVGN